MTTTTSQFFSRRSILKLTCRFGAISEGDIFCRGLLIPAQTRANAHFDRKDLVGSSGSTQAFVRAVHSGNSTLQEASAVCQSLCYSFSAALPPLHYENPQAALENKTPQVSADNTCIPDCDFLAHHLDIPANYACGQVQPVPSLWNFVACY